MRTYIVTEGKLESALLERLVQCHPVLRERVIQMHPMENRTSAHMAARTLLILRHEPVAMINSPETLSPRLLAEQRAFLEWRLGEAGAPEDWLVVLVPPNVAVLLFRDDAIMSAVLPGRLSIEERIRGRYEPRAVLTELFAGAGEGPFPEALIQRIARADLSPLWRLEVLQTLETFLLRVSRVQEAGSPATQ
ncbi:hypothetical protein [Pyxidicoccus sp. MSG2]|uniref:hypothetical protein n=1 Tax=Pyxidicoccus sp. MSG2 TaxID=2996790 RepID=UPI0022713E39|nr:hypothetical protein [Pyxidicoccus sp. MSG2]MCY1021161.1 hypothetical protein [Pyxidicoccus sp. MSG2]